HHVLLPLPTLHASVELVSIARASSRLTHVLINSSLHFLPAVSRGKIRITRHDTRRTDQFCDFSHNVSLPPGKENIEIQATFIHPNHLTMPCKMKMKSFVAGRTAAASATC